MGFVTVGASDSDRIALVHSGACVPHHVIGVVAVLALHAGGVMSVGGHALDRATVGEPQLRLIHFGQASVAQGNPPGARMTAETPRVRDFRCQSRMRVFRMFGDVACQAATAAARGFVHSVNGFGMIEMTTRALLPEHRVGDTVAQRSQGPVTRVIRASVDNQSRRVDNAATRIHEAAGY